MSTDQLTTTEIDSDNNGFSDESQTTDYTSMEGIRTRTGTENDQLFGNFIIKELIDNALDFIEQHAKIFEQLYQNSGQKYCPYVNITITEENGITKINVRNSNSNIIENNVFSSKDQVKKIFEFDRYRSNKRHKFIIKRGALGDGLKEILGIPYAFAIENNDEDNWNYPLKINIANEKLFEIRITNLSEVKRGEKKPDIDVIETIETKENNNNKNNEDKFFTEITVYIPKTLTNYAKMRSLLTTYILTNTHIDFNIQFPTEQKPRQYQATQSITNWSNYQSIYYYSLSDFERLIYSFEDKSNSNIANYVQKYFREGTNIKRDELLEILNSNTTSNTENNKKNLQGIYHRLRRIDPIRNKSDKKPQLQVPFDRKLREQALRERFEQVFEIDETVDYGYVRYKKIIDYYYPSIIATSEEEENNNKIEYPFILEIVVADVPYLSKELHLISIINFSPSLIYNPFYNKSKEKIFTWKIKKTNKTESDDSITDILEDCGYSSDPKKHKKTGNVVLINLISPRIGYRNQSKSNINLKPFVSTSQEIYNFCKSVSSRNKNGIREGTSVINELRILLQERLHAVKNNDRLKETGRWTQSTVFYHLRPRLNEKGMKVERDYITGLIRPVCNDVFGKKRHELGIIAAERAQLYFKGESLGVGFEQLPELMKKGTDLLIIEKEGVADVLAPFAKQKGIAILNSRGFLTEYAEELSELAKQNGCNIAILTDLDSSGLIISTRIPNSYRI